MLNKLIKKKNKKIIIKKKLNKIAQLNGKQKIKIKT